MYTPPIEKVGGAGLVAIKITSLSICRSAPCHAQPALHGPRDSNVGDLRGNEVRKREKEKEGGMMSGRGRETE